MLLECPVSPQQWIFLHIIFISFQGGSDSEAERRRAERKKKQQERKENKKAKGEKKERKVRRGSEKCSMIIVPAQ